MEIFRVSAKLCGAVNQWGEPLPDPTLHDLRHTFASVMANEYKVGPRVLMQLMGHERIETTLSYYVEATDGALAEAMALVA
jgi:integrase